MSGDSEGRSLVAEAAHRTFTRLLSFCAQLSQVCRVNERYGSVCCLFCSVPERFLGSRICHTSLFPSATVYRVTVWQRFTGHDQWPARLMMHNLVHNDDTETSNADEQKRNTQQDVLQPTGESRKRERQSGGSMGPIATRESYRLDELPPSRSDSTRQRFKTTQYAYIQSSSKGVVQGKPDGALRRARNDNEGALPAGGALLNHDQEAGGDRRVETVPVETTQRTTTDLARGALARAGGEPGGPTAQGGGPGEARRSHDAQREGAAPTALPQQRSCYPPSACAPADGGMVAGPGGALTIRRRGPCENE